MKEIKAYVHANRIADVVHALKQAGFTNLSVIDVKGLLKALGASEQQYSIEIGEKVITEVKLEFVCRDEQLQRGVEIIRDNARTGQPEAGWIYVSNIVEAYPIEGPAAPGEAVP